MARAPETGFYFEPISERLALVVESSPFPTDDHWAWLGDPIEMTPQQAQLLVAVRWPGIDPEDLTVEFDLNFERAVQEAEALRAEKAKGVERVPTELDVDIDQLLAQAELIRDQVRQSVAEQGPHATAEANEAALQAAAQAEGLRALIEQARAMAEPTAAQRMSVREAQPQSQRLLKHVQEEAPAEVIPAPEPIEAPSGPALVPELVARIPGDEPDEIPVAARQARAAAERAAESDAELEAPPRIGAKALPEPTPGEPPDADGETRKGTRKRPPRIARGALRALEERQAAPRQTSAAKEADEPAAPKTRPRIERPKQSAEPPPESAPDSPPPSPAAPSGPPRRPNIRKR